MLRRELRFQVAEPRRWVGTVRRVLAARAIQGSNSIEGINVSVEDALAAVDGEDAVDASWTDAHAVQGYRRAMTYVVQLADDADFGYSTALIRSLHFMMTEYSLEALPGRWRSRWSFVRNDVTGALVYEGPDHELVPELMAELAERLNDADDAPPLVCAAMAHLNLVMIHPFRDGNGRMARALQTLVLAREGILAPELSSIEEYLGRNTQAYYDVLATVGDGSWRPDGSAEEWVRFCLQAHYIQAASVLRRLRESGRTWIELDLLRQETGLPERTMAVLFDAALGLRVRNAGYRAVSRGWGEEISNQVATNDLKRLVVAGFLEQRGVKCATHYLAAAPVRAVTEAVRRKRVPIDASGLFDPEPEPQLPL